MKIDTQAVDRLQNAERRYYVTLQQYDKALRSMVPPEILERYKGELCDAFAEVKAAQEALAGPCP